MRGDDRQQGSVFSYRSLEDRIPVDHPLRTMRAMVDAALDEMGPLLEGLYAQTGRPSIAPERLLRALLLQSLFTVRSERRLNDTHASTTAPGARLMRKTRHRGQPKVGWVFTFTAAAYNLVRMRNLEVALS